MSFISYSIVYSKSKERLNNFYTCKNIITDLKYIEAVDSINQYDKYKNFSLDNNLLTKEYIEKFSHLKGKIGCNLSHINVLQDFIQNNDVEWALVLEDDAELNQYDENKINYLVNRANQINSHFIQLYSFPQFLDIQKKQYEFDNNLYKMVEQWSTLAYLISKNGANLILQSCPLNENIDELYSRNISKLNSICYINNIFQNKYILDTGNGHDIKNKSLIWNN